METNFRELIPSAQHNVCPVHNVRPFINTDNDHITIRCCCELFTDSYKLTIVDKINGKTLTELFDNWETDLLINELQIA